jgi:adenylate cyclase
VTVGLMGSDAHILNFTVFGREVNLASRLEGVSGRARIIIGEQTYAALLRDDPKLAATCVALDPVAVKGFRAPVKIYEVPWKTEAMLTADTSETPAAKGEPEGAKT